MSQLYLLNYFDLNIKHCPDRRSLLESWIYTIHSGAVKEGCGALKSLRGGVKQVEVSHRAQTLRF